MDLLTLSFAVIVWISVIACFIVWAVALTDISKSNFKGKNERLLRGLLILFIPAFGTFLYFAVGRKNKSKLN
jgi:hypothetical protein